MSGDIAEEDGVHVEDVGSGPALLCLHGLGSSSASFLPQMRHFGSTRRVLAWDAPGYAKSADRGVPLGMSGYADHAAHVLTSREVGWADALGVSFGGVVAVCLAIRHPDLVRSLVLADTTLGSRARGSPEEKAMRRRGGELAQLGPAGLVAVRAPRLLSPEAPHELIAQVERNMAESIRLPGYAHAAEAMAGTDLRAEMSQLSVPTLVVCGTKDTVTGPETSRAIANTIPGSRLVMIQDSGHLSNQEKPDQFNAVIADFLDEVDAWNSMPGTAERTGVSR